MMQQLQAWVNKRLVELRAERVRDDGGEAGINDIFEMDGKIAAFEEMEAYLREEHGRVERMRALHADLAVRREQAEAEIVESEGRAAFLAMQGTCPHWMEGPDRGLGPPTGTRCSVCREPQYKSYGGNVCKNGHGGADPLDE
jgi:hypothetical protein